MLFSPFENFRTVDQDFTNIPTQIVTDGADNDVTFLMDQERGRLLIRRTLDRVPMFQQDIQIPLQLLFRFADTSGTNDQAHPFGDFQAIEGFFELGTFITFDAAGNTTGTRVVRHQNQVAASQTDESRQRCTLGASLFFINLHYDFVTFFDHLFDVGTAGEGVVSREVFASNLFEWQEPMALGAIIHKCGFQTWLYAGDFTLVDVCFFLLMSRAFDIQVVNALPINEGNAQLFFLSCVN